VSSRGPFTLLDASEYLMRVSTRGPFYLIASLTRASLTSASLTSALSATYASHATNITCDKHHMRQTSHATNITCDKHHMRQTSKLTPSHKPGKQSKFTQKHTCTLQYNPRKNTYVISAPNKLNPKPKTPNTYVISAPNKLPTSSLPDAP